MSVIADTYAKMEEARQLVAAIQAECSHPEAGLSTRECGRNDRMYEDSDDGYVGEFVNHWVPMVEHTCGLCGWKWTEDVAEDDN